MDSDSEEERMEKKKRRRIKRPEPDSSDEDGEPFTLLCSRAFQVTQLCSMLKMLVNYFSSK